VRDEASLDSVGKPRAWNLEAEALNGTDEENAAYIEHHNRISDHIKAYNVLTDELVKKTNAEIEAMHVEFFGAPLEI